ncbi:MAG: hypothetical protein L7R49_02445, partial [Nitrosopumilus sp.]|nr:hypothetical protein [Nitrosopumilus sp.]
MKTFKDISRKETDLEEACWVGYKKVGMKKKGERMVPNCVKEEVVDAVLGKDYIHAEGVEDMYKGKLNKDQLNTIKNTWKNKKQSDVTQGVKDMIKGYDMFTRMDIKKANIKYLSNLINDEVQHEEVDFISPLQDQIEIVEMNSVVRKTELKEFSADQIERLAKAYNVMKDRTISLANAKKLGAMMDKVPASSLNDLRKKKIPFISGLALSRMIKMKMPVTEGLDKEDEKSVDDVVKQLKKAVKAHQGQVKTLTKDLKDEKDLEEADLSKSQIKQVHKKADDLPKKDFMKRYGKDGDAVRYATATNMVKKKLGIGEDHKLIKKGELKMNESYKLKLNSAMEHYKIDSLGELKDEDQKEFFNYVDSLTEGLTAGQKKLPPALQKAIAAKQDKKDDKKEMHDMKKKEIKEEDAYDKDDPKQKPKKEMMKDMKEMMKEMMEKMSSEMKELKAETDPKKMEMMKKEMMTAMKKMPEMAEMSEMMKNEMMKEMMKKMDEYGNMNAMKKEMKEPMNAMKDMMKAQAMKMPIKSMKKMEDLVGGQKKLDKDKDGDLDAQDFAALRKSKNEAVKTGEADAEPKTKELNAMVKDPHKSMTDKPMKDMNATYMKSNVKAPVMNNGGSDMAKVKDKPE